MSAKIMPTRTHKILVARLTKFQGRGNFIAAIPRSMGHRYFGIIHAFMAIRRSAIPLGKRKVSASVTSSSDAEEFVNRTVSTQSSFESAFHSSATARPDSQLAVTDFEENVPWCLPLMRTRSFACAVSPGLILPKFKMLGVTLMPSTTVKDTGIDATGPAGTVATFNADWNDLMSRPTVSI